MRRAIAAKVRVAAGRADAMLTVRIKEELFVVQYVVATCRSVEIREPVDGRVEQSGDAGIVER